MIKFLKKLLIFVLIVPMTLAFAGCKKNKNNNDNSDGTQQEQPVNPGTPEDPGDNQDPDNPDVPDDPETPDDPGTGEDPENPDDPGTGEDPEDPENPGGEDPGTGEDPENPDVPDVPDDPIVPEIKTYSVSFDYSLPDSHDFLLNDYSVTKNVGENTSLPTINDTNLSKYFLGWFDKSTDEQISDETVSASANETKSVYGKWDTENLLKYYYTEGLTFVEGEDSLGNLIAVVESYTGENTKIILPKLYSFEEDKQLAVKTIKANAFEESNVVEIVNNSQSMIIEENAFLNSKLEKFDFSNVVSIGANSFKNTKLKNVEFSGSLEYLGNYAFANCSSLESIDMSKIFAITKVSNYVFSGCSSLSDIKLSVMLTSIGEGSFSGCAIENLNFIPSSITSISNYAFKNCTSLVTANLADTLTDIGFYIFDGCEKLQNLRVYDLYTSSSESLSTHYGDVSNSLKKIEILGEKITVIPTSYFNGYLMLEEAVLSDFIAEIKPYAFAGCVSLQTFNFPIALNIETFDVSAISDTAFYKNMTSVFYINDILFSASNVTDSEVVIKSGTTSILYKAFYKNKTITKVTIPSSVKIIGVNAFAQCSNLKTVIFEENNELTEIPSYMFYRCSLLESVNTSNLKAVNKIGKYSFAETKLTGEFVLPESLETMDDYALLQTKISAFSVADANECFSVEDGVLYTKTMDELVAYPAGKTTVSFTIPTSVEKIRTKAFAYNSYISIININSETMDFGDEYDSDVFFGAGSSRGLFILTENENLSLSSLDAKMYYLLSDGYEYDNRSGKYEIAITDKNSVTNLNQYIVFNDGNADICLLLHLNVSGETYVVMAQNDVSDLV